VPAVPPLKSPAIPTSAAADASSSSNKSKDAQLRAAKFRQMQEDAVKRWRKRETH
jgi:hypothetical protein